MALTVVLAIIGVPVAAGLSPSGFADPGSESARASQTLTSTFGQGDVVMLIVVSSPDGVDSPAARDTGRRIAQRVAEHPYVATVSSAWTTPPAAAADLVSRDRTAGLVVVGITGSEAEQQTYAKDIDRDVTRDVPAGVTVRTGGTAMVNVQITEHSQRDLLLMEVLAIPLSFLVLVWVFGGLLAAALPVAIGGDGDRRRAGGAAGGHLRHRRVDLRAEPDHRDGAGPGHRLHAADREPLPRRARRRAGARPRRCSARWPPPGAP